MNRALGILTFALLLALAAFALRGTYTRYRTDDFCTAASLKERGYFESQRFFRDGWSGRFSYYAIKHTLESIGPFTARVVPGAMVMLLVVASVWTLRRFLDARLALAGGCAVAFANVDSAPELFSAYGPLFWECGAVTYLLPVVLIAFWVGVVLRSSNLIVAFLLMFIAGGLSETAVAAQLPLAIGAVILARNRAAVAGLAGTLAAFAVMATAPGNAVRAATLDAPATPLDAAANTLQLAYSYLGSHLFLEGASLLIVLVLGLVAAPRIPHRIALGTAATAVVAYIATCAPSAWALSSGPPARALVVSNFFLIVMLFALGALLRVPHPALVAIAAIIPILSVVSVARDLPRARADAAHADTIDRLLREQRGRDVVLRSRWALAERFATQDPRHWSNGCVSDYHRLTSLSVTR